MANEESTKNGAVDKLYEHINFCLAEAFCLTILVTCKLFLPNLQTIFLTGLESQVSGLQRQVTGLNDKLSDFDVARLSADLNRVTILEAERDEEILRLKATPSDAGFECGLGMQWTKEEFAVVLKKISQFILGRRIGLLKLPLVAYTDYAFLNKISEHAA
ncbi:hypothetical protein Tco_0324525 [Tanacetum coccineum]